ncbi:MAG: 23S rRNA (guanosine(2251)-2'-O)-methyltransferase RlmB [Lewinellaceae bacterium]|nr:23S rRNA (guanosine(2251)-2'-O)-methyltransferase RlmB [Lewinellaceae bacterium]
MVDQVFGRNPVLEALENDSINIEKIYILQSITGDFEKTVRSQCKRKNIDLARVPEQKLNELTRHKNHQGIVATIAPIIYQEYTDVIDTVLKKNELPIILILDNITDVRNIGAIARSAYFFGAHSIILTGNHSGGINDLSVKTSAGALLHLPVCKGKNLFNVVSDMQSLGIKVVATTSQTGHKLEQCDMSVGLAILLGSEGSGIHNKVLDVVDETIQIGAINAFDSLNVSVAAGILLYELQRQRHHE